MNKIAFGVIIVILLISCNRNIIQITCPDGNIAIIEKESPFQKFQDEEKEKNAKLSIEVSDFLKSDAIDFSTKKKIMTNMEKLNQVSSTYWISLNALYLDRKMNPCDKELSLDYRNRIERMHNRLIQLETLRLNIEKILKESGIGGGNGEIVNLELIKLIKVSK